MKLHVAHVEDHFLPTSGYQVNFLAKWNVLHGHRVTIVTSRSLRPWESRGFVPEEFVRDVRLYDEAFEHNTGVKVMRLPTAGCFSSREIFYPSVFSTLERLKPDVVLVHGNDTLTGIRFIMRAAKLGYPIVSDNHMAEVASVNRLRNHFRRFYRTVVTPKIIEQDITVIVLAEDIQDYCMKHFAIPQRLLPVVSWGVDTELFKPDEKVREAFRTRYGISAEDFVCVYTGKISSDKKVQLLARAFRERFDGQRRAVLLVVGSGSGPYYEETMRIFGESSNKVLTFPTQRVVDLPRFYQAADLAIWPGGCSLSFFDAQGSRLPVLAEDIEANRVRIGPGQQNGFLYRVDDSKDLRRHIAQCITMDPEKLHQMGHCGMGIVRSRFSYDSIATRIENIMQEVRERWLSCRGIA